MVMIRKNKVGQLGKYFLILWIVHIMDWKFLNGKGHFIFGFGNDLVGRL